MEPNRKGRMLRRWGESPPRWAVWLMGAMALLSSFDALLFIRF